MNFPLFRELDDSISILSRTIVMQKKVWYSYVYKITFSGQGVIPYRRYSPRAKQA